MFDLPHLSGCLWRTHSFATMPASQSPGCGCLGLRCVKLGSVKLFCCSRPLVVNKRMHWDLGNRAKEIDFLGICVLFIKRIYFYFMYIGLLPACVSVSLCMHYLQKKRVSSGKYESKFENSGRHSFSQLCFIFKQSKSPLNFGKISKHHSVLLCSEWSSH